MSRSNLQQASEPTAIHGGEVASRAVRIGNGAVGPTGAFPGP